MKICELSEDKFCCFDLDPVCSDLCDEKVRVSDNAGEYICNYMFYSALKHAEKIDSCTALFVHFPTFQNVAQEEQVTFVKALIKKLASC